MEAIDPRLDPTNARFIDPENDRYILEMEREKLLADQTHWDRQYGTVSFAFLTSLQTLALFAYMLIAIMLTCVKKNWSKTNGIITLWSLINAMVILEKLSMTFYILMIEDSATNETTARITDMLAALGRSYGTMLAIVWLHSRFWKQLTPKYDFFCYLLILGPTAICLFYIVYYFQVNEFIFEVFGPGCDVVHLTVYILVAFIYILCKIFGTDRHTATQGTLLIALVNFVTNLPICLITIYLRFVLDIGWVYKFRVYFVDFIVNVIGCSNAFIVLLILILCNENVKVSLLRRKKDNFEKVALQI